MNSPSPAASGLDPHAAVSRGQRWIIAGLLAALIALGAVTEIRSAYLKRRMTDLDCYLRAAWAIRTGVDPYSVVEENGWHYCYPHFLAVMLGPLADPPPSGARIVALPWAASVAVWYFIGAVAAVAGIHFFVSTLEAGPLTPPRRFGAVWWSNRLMPFLFATPMIGRTIVRGQVDTVVLALLAGWVVNVTRGRRVMGGTFLAFAACIKIIPALLFLHPLIRRDRRCLAGVGLGLVVGLGVIPALAVGPNAAIAQSRTFLNAVVLPGVGTGSDRSRAHELTDVTTTSSQSVESVIHYLAYPDPVNRPIALATSTAHQPLVDRGCNAGGRVLARWSSAGDAFKRSGLHVALCVVMVVICPVCHLHYFIFAIPSLTGLWCGPQSRNDNAADCVHGGPGPEPLSDYAARKLDHADSRIRRDHRDRAGRGYRGLNADGRRGRRRTHRW